jgi:hypothetical protein
LTFIKSVPGGEEVICKGEFSASDVHKQYGISFRTPAFPNPNITERVQVAMQLYKPSDKVSVFQCDQIGRSFPV